jgi:hypothetical protein
MDGDVHEYATCHRSGTGQQRLKHLANNQARNLAMSVMLLQRSKLMKAF